MSALKARSVLRRALEKPLAEGGAYIRRPIGPATTETFMPFLLLDDVETKGKSPGFGDHPHRGQETMTYLLDGSLIHQDSNGGEGVLHAGDLQAMRAGRGIIHNETPVENPKTNMTHGLQLWVALPESNLNDDPAYQDVLSSKIPVAQPSPGVTIKVVAGDSFGSKAPILTRAPVWYFDINLAPDTKIAHPIPKNWNTFVIVLEGNPTVAGKPCVPHETTFFQRDGGDVVELENQFESSARMVLIAGDPLDGQEVYHYGPFVSTTRNGINKAMHDYRMGINGFERSSWTSKHVDQ